MSKKVPLLPLLTIIFIGTFSFSVVLPFLIFLVLDFGGNAFIFGLIMAMYPLSQMIGSPIMGRLSDVWGRKKILIITHVGTTVAWVVFMASLFMSKEHLLSVESGVLGVFAITMPLIVLFLARFLDGITGGNVAVANAYIADVSSKKERSKNYGKMGVASSLGFIAGPALAGVLGSTMYEEFLPVLAALTVSVVGLFIIVFQLKESNGPVNRRKQRKLSIWQVLKIRHMRYMFLLYFLIFLGFTTMYASFPIHAAENLMWDVAEVGIFFVVLAALMAVVQGPVLGKISGKISEGMMIVVGSLSLVASFVMLTSLDIVVVYASTVFFAVGNGIMWPSVLSMMSKFAGKKHQGAVQGVGAGFGSLASIIGLVVGGILYGFVGPATFLVSGGVMFLVFLLSLRCMVLKCD